MGRTDRYEVLDLSRQQAAGGRRNQAFYSGLVALPRFPTGSGIRFVTKYRSGLREFPAWDSAAVAQKPWFSSIGSDKVLDLPPEPAFGPANTSSLRSLGLSNMNASIKRRFLDKIEPVLIPLPESCTPGECWLWHGHQHDKGYGKLYLGFDKYGRKIVTYAHRLSFEHFFGFPPPGYIIDHECNHKNCCAPHHLQPVSNLENLRLADERQPWQRRNQYSKE